MAEVLSQSQIDALLNAVRSGEKELDSTQEESAEKKYKKYDFYSPKKFTKDRIKMLNGIFENYTRIINSRLNALLHSNCEVEVESVEEQRYYEFSNALREGDVLALAEVDIRGKSGEAPVLLYLSTGLALNMMDRLLGGEGDTTDTSMDYMYTDLELRLYETLMTDLVSMMGGSWEHYLDIDFAYSRTEVNPSFVQLLGIDEIVVIVDLKLQFTEKITGRMSICLPGEVLNTIFADIGRNKTGKSLVGENKSDEIFDHLQDSSLEIIAELGSTHVSLSDIYHLHVGDVIDLGHSKDSPIYLEIGGYRWFAGYVGTYKKNMAVKIQEIYQPDYQPESRSS